MGFKKINKEELETKSGPCFIGMPLRRALGKDLQIDVESLEAKQGHSMGTSSNIFIKNEEVLEFQYDYAGKRKSLTGAGNILISNMSDKDRIWDAKLKFSGSEFINIEAGDDVHLGIFEPNSTKTINYEIINTNEIDDMLEITEEIEVMNEEIELYQDKPQDSEDLVNKIISSEEDKKFLLLQGKENRIKFTIILENISPHALENIKFKKQFSKSFFGLQWESQIHTNIDVKGDSLNWTVSELRPGAGVRLIIYAKIIPKNKEAIRTGKIEISYNLKERNFSGTEIEEFSAYSHAMHAIHKIEEEDNPNHWQCLFKFENHCDFPIKLKSILVSDKSKSNTYLDLNFDPSNKERIILPGGKFLSDKWKIIDKDEPKFSRKIEYSIDYDVQQKSTISTQIDDYKFELVDVEIKKDISKEEIKSFEESELNSKVIIKNMGTIPIDSILIKEMIPKNFLPPEDLVNLKIKSSKKTFKPDDYHVLIEPKDNDPAKEHILEVRINPSNNHLKHAISVNDFIELEYTIKAVNPDNTLKYDFPLEIESYYMKSTNGIQSDLKEYYRINTQLDQSEKPNIKISHRRRKITIEKEIFPGKNMDEFSISITVKNLSNIEIKNVDLSDNFPDTFKLISSNVEKKLEKPNKDGFYTISFVIDKILPYQEKEITYYLKNESGKQIQYSELESYLYG